MALCYKWCSSLICKHGGHNQKPDTNPSFWFLPFFFYSISTPCTATPLNSKPKEFKMIKKKRINNHRSFCSISTQHEPQLSHICKATLLTSISLKVLQSTLSLSGGRKNGFWISKMLFLGVKKTSLEARAFYNLQWVAARDGHTDAATRAKFTKSRRNCGHPRPRQLMRRFRSPSVSENKGAD